MSKPRRVSPNKGFTRVRSAGGGPAARGFTLVELLVVIAIIGILVALLLPAVQAAREAARRMQCTNNMKQLALAGHNYHDTHQSFPSGYIRGPWNMGSSRECWGWHVLLMPFIEQGPLHDQLDTANYTLEDVCAGLNPSVPNPVATLQTRISAFICPSDSNEDELGHRDRHFGGGVGTEAGGLGEWRPGLTNYLGLRGTKDMPQDTSDTHGTLFYNSNVNMRDISDGTSSTFMIGERDSLRCRAGTWPGVRNAHGHGGRGFWTSVGHVRTVLNAPDPPFGWGSNRGCGESFGSMHPSGANFAFCDGSVHFISENIEFDDASCRNGCCVYHGDVRRPECSWFSLYTRLGRRNDGLPVSDF
ncbi:MAG: DUF1559 domain-containing protein [Pirellulaceae bacterium]